MFKCQTFARKRCRSGGQSHFSSCSYIGCWSLRRFDLYISHIYQCSSKVDGKRAGVNGCRYVLRNRSWNGIGCPVCIKYIWCDHFAETKTNYLQQVSRTASWPMTMPTAVTPTREKWRQKFLGAKTIPFSMVFHMWSRQTVDIPIDFVILQLGYHVTQQNMWLSICSNYTQRIEYRNGFAKRGEEHTNEPIGAVQPINKNNQRHTDFKNWLFIAHFQESGWKFLHWPFRAFFSAHTHSLVAWLRFKQHRKEEDLFVQWMERKMKLISKEKESKRHKQLV